MATTDRKSTRLNSSHTIISYAVFCLKKKRKKIRKIESTKRAAKEKMAITNDPLARHPADLKSLRSLLRSPKPLTPQFFFFFNNAEPPDIHSFPLPDLFLI